MYIHTDFLLNLLIFVCMLENLIFPVQSLLVFDSVSKGVARDVLGR